MAGFTHIKRSRKSLVDEYRLSTTSIRSRPIRAFAMQSTTATCASVRSARVEMRAPGPDVSRLHRGRVTSHDTAIHDCARIETGPLPTCLRLQLLPTNRALRRIQRSPWSSGRERPSAFVRDWDLRLVDRVRRSPSAVAVRVAPTPEFVETFAAVAPGGLLHPTVLFREPAESLGPDMHRAYPRGLQLGIPLEVRRVLVKANQSFWLPVRKRPGARGARRR